MNKSDYIVIGVLIFFSSLCVLFFKLNEKQGSVAHVYHDQELMLKIDLTKEEEQQFDVAGDNGNVHIIAEKGKIKVDTENSPLNLCSKQGYIESSFETIVCLPNKIVIKIIDSEEIDTVVK